MQRDVLAQAEVDVGMEGSAKYIFVYVDEWVQKKTNQRVYLHSVECIENEKNSAVFYG